MGRASGMAAAVVLVPVVLGVYVQGTNALVCTKEFKEKGCNRTLSELFTADQFEAMFKHRNDRRAQAQGFWSYDGFMAAAKAFEKKGFASVGGDDVQLRELAAFFAHVDGIMLKTVLTHGGLCYNEELAPEKDYCKAGDLMYPCAPGAGYYRRGAFPLYWNYNYCPTGVALKQDLLHHPELLSKNETIARQAAIWYWMTPAKTRPSPHEVMVGKWVPTRTDLLAFRKPGFGMTINVKASYVECGHGEDPRMQSRVSHFTAFLTILTGNDMVDPGQNLDCGLQGVVPQAYATI